MIAVVVQGTSFLLPPDDARKLIQELQAALVAHVVAAYLVGAM